MLDYRFIKDNLEAVKENIKNRNMTADADLVVQLFDERTALTTKLQSLQQKRNENAASMKQKLDAETRAKYIEEGKDHEGKGYDPRKLLKPGCEAVVAKAEELIKAYGSDGKAE